MLLSVASQPRTPQQTNDGPLPGDAMRAPGFCHRPDSGGGIWMKGPRQVVDSLACGAPAWGRLFLVRSVPSNVLGWSTLRVPG